MLDSLNRYFAAWLATLRSMFEPAIWLPFLLLSAVQGLLLWFLVIAPTPSLGGWPLEILRYWFGETAVHYPGHFLIMPAAFFRSVIFLYGVFGIIAFAIATGGYSRKFTGSWEGPHGLTKTALRRFLPLFAIWGVSIAVIYFGLSRLPMLFTDWTLGSPRRGILIDAGTRIVVVAFMSFWAYTTVAIIVDRANLWGAVKTSFRRCLKHPLATFFLLGIPYAITVPFALLASRSEYLTRQFRPETVILALALVILSQFVANILTCGSVTHYYLAEPTGE